MQWAEYLFITECDNILNYLENIIELNPYDKRIEEKLFKKSFKEKLGISVTYDPLVPKGHMFIISGNKTYISYPKFLKTTLWLNNLAPDHFGECEPYSYDVVSLGEIDLYPQYVVPELGRE